MADFDSLLELGRGMFMPNRQRLAQIKAIREGISPDEEVMTGDPGLSPGLAVVPTLKNYGKFMNTMLKIMGSPKVEKLPSTIQNALGYMGARYPRVLRSLEGGVEVVSDIPKGAAARVLTNPVTRKPQKILLSTRPWSKAKPGPSEAEEVVNALSHELRHVIDIRKPHWSALMPYYSPTYSGKPATRLLDELRYFLYRSQPIEKRAFQAGRKGSEGYRAFENLLSKVGDMW